MAQNSHYMASFLHFRAILATLLAVRTTFMVTLGIGRTQALATHVGRWCEAIFALSGYLYGAGVVQNMAIFGVKIRAHNLCHDNRQLIVIAINRNRSASKNNCN